MGLSWLGGARLRPLGFQMSPDPCSPPTEALTEGQPLLLLAETCMPV